jgi:hypothetical protein
MTKVNSIFIVILSIVVVGVATLLIVLHKDDLKVHGKKIKEHFKKLKGPSASTPHNIAAMSGVEIFENGLGSLQTVTDQQAIALLEGDGSTVVEGSTNFSGATSGRPEPRLSVAEVIDFQKGSTQAGVGEEEYFEGAELHPGTAVNPMTLDTIDESPGGADGMHGASADEFINAEGESEIYGDENPMTEQGHAGGIVPISLALQTNYGKQDISPTFQIFTGFNPQPSREECKHLCLNGGDPAYVDLCDCTGYIKPITGLGPLERRVLNAV